jgi:hypothetical protein
MIDFTMTQICQPVHGIEISGVRDIYVNDHGLGFLQHSLMDHEDIEPQSNDKKNMIKKEQCVTS